MLPKINEVPTYRFNVPSTGEELSFRPFFVKEQKVLLVAIESQDEMQIIDSIVNTIEACVPDVNLSKLSTFDLEYIFTKIRSKSVGEKSKISVNCTECQTPNEVLVDLDDIKVDMKNKDTMIKLNPQITIEMQYPHYDHMRENGKLKDINSATDAILQLTKSCMSAVLTEEERVSFKDYSEAEIDEFIESMTPDQFNELVDWTTNLPKLTHDIEFDCVSCQHKNTQTLEGLQNFFS